MASLVRRPNGKWRARYRDPSKKEISKDFARKEDAQRHLDEVTASLVTGRYIDPKAGSKTFEDFSETDWRPHLQHRASTAEMVERNLRLHVYPQIGSLPLAALRPSDIKRLQSHALQTLEPSTVKVIHRWVSAILTAAVTDRLIAESPARGIKAPKVTPRRIRPQNTNSIVALVKAMPAHYRALIVLCAGTGLRQAEALGLTRDRIDLQGQKIEIDRQLMRKPSDGKLLGPLKTDASYRSVPLPQVVCDALEAHLAARGPCSGDDLVFVNELGRPVMWQRFSEALHDACASAGLARITSHDLRHYYASLLIRHGESVKVVQERLGHASASETLDTYSHLWPDSDDRTREAVDDVLGPEYTDPSLSAHTARRIEGADTVRTTPKGDV